MRELSDTAETRLLLYLKEEHNFGADTPAGLDAVGRLVADDICVAIKYAITRANPSHDTYLEGLLKRVARERVVSGMGERPALVHMRKWELAGFTTGSGCIAPSLSQAIFDACGTGDFTRAETLRSGFLPLEDLRDAWNPAKVLHHAVELAEVAATGPVPPFLSSLTSAQIEQTATVARALAEANAAFQARAT